MSKKECECESRCPKAFWIDEAGAAYLLQACNDCGGEFIVLGESDRYFTIE